MSSLSKLEVGQCVRATVGVVSANIAQTSRGQNYLNVMLTDGTTEMAAKMWDYGGTMKQPGTVVNIIGSVSEYQGAKQIILSRINDNLEVDTNEFRKCSLNNIEDMYTDLRKAANRVGGQLGADLKCILTTYEDSLMIAPGAKAVHHNFVGGLIQHMLEVLEISLDMAQKLISYNPSLKIDFNILIAGALLHDIGKLECYEWQGFAIVDTEQNLFMDHIVAGARLLMFHEIDNDHLYHIIASHHGRLEYGSPVLPASIEAQIIHNADMISSKAGVILEEQQKPGNWSERSNFFMGRKIYRGQK